MPRATSCSVRERIALDAPRILNEPVFCRFSHLKKSPAPAMAFRDADVRTGVRWILGAMRACAARMVSHVGGWYWMDSVDEAVFMILVLGSSGLLGSPSYLPFISLSTPFKKRYGM